MRSTTPSAPAAAPGLSVSCGSTAAQAAPSAVPAITPSATPAITPSQAAAPRFSVSGGSTAAPKCLSESSDYSDHSEYSENSAPSESPATGYYQRTEVSNSDLTALKELLHPAPSFGDRETAFRFGTLVDALITEPERVNHYRRTVDDVPYNDDEWRHAREMQRSLRMEAQRDPFLKKVLDTADTQRCMVRAAQPFTYGGFPFTLDTRCKWDWFLPVFHFGGDLKTTSAATQQEFDEAVDFFDWDRSRAWYMDIAGSDRDFIYGVSKRNCRVFKLFIRRGDPVYTQGRAKYEELAFQYWCLNL